MDTAEIQRARIRQRIAEKKALLAQQSAGPTPTAPAPTSISAEVSRIGGESGAPTSEDDGFLKTVGKVAADIGKGVLESPRAITTGALKAVNEVSDVAYELGEFLNQKALDLGYVHLDLDPDTPLWESRDARETRMRALGIDHTKANEANKIRLPVFLDEAESTTGKMISGVTQFAVGMIGASRAMKAGMGVRQHFTGSLVARAAVADAVAFDPHEQRLSNLIQQFPALQNPLTEALAADPADGTWEGRFKNAVEGFVIGGVADALVGIVRATRAYRKGDKPGLDEAAAELDAILTKNGIDVEDAIRAADNQPAGPRRAEAQADPDNPNATPKADPTEGPTTTETGSPAPKTDPQKTPESKPLFTIDPKVMEEYRLDLQTAPTRPLDGSVPYLIPGIDLNFANITDVGAIKESANMISTYFEEGIRKVKGGNEKGVMTWVEAEKRAAHLLDDVGADINLGLQRLKADATSAQNLDAKVRAHGTVFASLLNEQKRLADAVAAGHIYRDLMGDDLLREFERVTTMAVEAQAYLKGMRTNIARAQNIAKMSLDVNQSLMKTAGDRSLVEIKRDALRVAANPNKSIHSRSRALHGTASDKFWGLHTEYWINAILSGPKTHVVNMLTGAVHLGYRPIERSVGGLLTGNKEMMKEGFYQYQGMAYALKDAFRLATTVLFSKTGSPILDVENIKFDPGMGRHFWAKETFGKEGSVGFLIDGLGQIIRLSGRFLASEDEFLKQLSFRSTVFAKAKQAAQARGLSPEDTMVFIQKSLDSAVIPKTGAANLHSKMGRRALQESRETTWTQDLEGGLGQSLQNLKGKHPWVNVILPFVRTPTNLLRWAWQRTPYLNQYQFQHAADLKSGDPERIAMAKARTALGAAMWSTATILALQGNYTGAGPTNLHERRVKESTGWKPFSIRVVNDDGTTTYVQMNRADPFFMALGIAADVAESFSRMDELQGAEMAAALIAAVGRNITSKTYMQGLSNVIEVIGDPTKENLANYLRNQGASYVPAMAATITQWGEGPKEARTLLEKMWARIPGLSGTLDPKRNLLGEVVSPPTGFGPDLISPFATGHDKNDVVVNALADLEKAYQPPPTSFGNVDLLAEEFKGPPDENGWRQSAYDRYLELIGSTTDSQGQTIRDKIESLVNSDQWQRLTDTVTVAGMSYPGSRQQAIERILRVYRDTAKVKLLRENEALMKAFKADKQNQIEVLRFGRLSTLNP